ncbi:hypothetical protein SAMN06298212_10969 [Ruaniaceae bacterium KH17]|nr:hypothetical protein SAMN06298212_10969 [Ruaniaceae bacterium KH17]
MYGLIWRMLPGPVWFKAILAILLIVAVVYLLFVYVYPVVAPYMPFQEDSVVNV